MICQWLPQNDILTQPSVKLFISHGGQNGEYEAVYYGVPMIVFSVMTGQYYNANRLDHKDFGLSMNFTADQLLDNINNVLQDKSYKDSMSKATEIFRSQVQSPVERATFWVEHICRSSTFSWQRLTTVLVPYVGRACLHPRHSPHLHLPALLC